MPVFYWGAKSLGCSGCCVLRALMPVFVGGQRVLVVQAAAYCLHCCLCLLGAKESWLFRLLRIACIDACVCWGPKSLGVQAAAYCLHCCLCLLGAKESWLFRLLRIACIDACVCWGPKSLGCSGCCVLLALLPVFVEGQRV